MNFDKIIERRGSGSIKWDRYAGRELLPMWIADMDFAAPEVVLAALHERVDHGVFGYPLPTAAQQTAVVQYLQARYGWQIKPNWIVWLPGVGPALNLACRSCCEPDQAVLTTTPIYPPFLSAPRFSRRQLQTAPLTRDGDTWRLDFDALEAAVTPQTRLLMLCNPYNPVARVWRRDELLEIGAFCERHDLIYCSDEIHCDLILDPLPHLPFADLTAAFAARTITLMAPSKTYNLPGLCCAFAIISDGNLRRRFKAEARGLMPESNVLGLAACTAALQHGEPWRQALLAYLRDNRDLVARTVAELPGLEMSHIEATYLAWIDTRDSGIADPAKFFEDAGVALSDGAAFAGAGFVRLNFGCPRSVLQLGLDRMREALS